MSHFNFLRLKWIHQIQSWLGLRAPDSAGAPISRPDSRSPTSKEKEKAKGEGKEKREGKYKGGEV